MSLGVWALEFTSFRAGRKPKLNHSACIHKTPAKEALCVALIEKLLISVLNSNGAFGEPLNRLTKCFGLEETSVLLQRHKNSRIRVCGEWSAELAEKEGLINSSGVFNVLLRSVAVDTNHAQNISKSMDTKIRQFKFPDSSCWKWLLMTAVQAKSTCKKVLRVETIPIPQKHTPFGDSPWNPFLCAVIEQIKHRQRTSAVLGGRDRQRDTCRRPSWSCELSHKWSSPWIWNVCQSKRSSLFWSRMILRLDSRAVFWKMHQGPVANIFHKHNIDHFTLVPVCFGPSFRKRKRLCKGRVGTLAATKLDVDVAITEQKNDLILTQSLATSRRL